MKKMIKAGGFAAVLLPAVTVCVLLAGCSRSSETEEAAAVDAFDNLISVGFSQLGSESVWRSANTVSFQETFTRENGYFLLYENARQKQENQIKAIRSFISQRVDYIVFSPVTETGWDTVLEEAREAGIPVITSDRQVVLAEDAGEGLVSAWVGGDMAAEGYKAAEWLRENTEEDEKLNIVVLTGTEGSSAALGRSEGFHSISDTMENWTVLEEKCGDFTLAKGQEIMEYYLDTYPDIDVLVSQNDDMTFGAIEAMRSRGIEPGSDIIIISYDAVREALKMVRDGYINVDVECSPLLGPYVDELIRKMEKGEPFEISNPVDELVFTADNVEEYLEGRTY
ncbi:MAG: ABC transporter substrate-binding protein [Lachnospiraceae bacterium]|nr:ABC transporter substrate-binding protein [Lachnospiraceae bacterium]